MVRIDYAPWGLVPPHTHPRASEILVVLKGTVLVGFVTSSHGNPLITKVLKKGDVFVFPIGLIHFQLNIGDENAFSNSGLGSQNPGVIMIPSFTFRATPPIPEDILAKAFQVDKSIVKAIESKF